MKINKEKIMELLSLLVNESFGQWKEADNVEDEQFADGKAAAYAWFRALINTNQIDSEIRRLKGQ